MLDLLRGCRPFALFLIAGCSATSPQSPRTATPDTVAERSVFDELHALERPDPPLLALPEWTRAALDTHLLALSEAERGELEAATRPEAEAHPLFHWAAGGNALSVYAASVQSSVLSDDWVLLASQSEKPVPPDELVRVGNELVRRAARHLLRERAADFAADRTPSVEALQQVNQAASLLEMHDLADRVALLWSQRDDAPEAQWVAFQSEVRALRLTAAALRLERLRREPKAVNYLPVAEADLEAARALAAGTGNAVERARAFSRLGQFERALETLQSGSGGLAQTTERLRAELGASICPHVLRPNNELCTTSFALESTRLGLEARLLEAWNGKAGRDGIAVEHFLGLSFVVPLMTLRAHDGSPLDRNGFAAALKALAVRAREASQETPRFEALAFLAEGLGEAISSTAQVGESGRAQIPEARRAQLRGQSLAAAARDPHRWFEAAALARLALSMQDDALGPALAELEVESGTELATLGSIGLWTALADHDVERLRRLDELLVAIARETPELERAAWLLAYAEANAALAPAEAAFTTLTRLTEPLGQGAHLALRLRSALDRAGVWARTGRATEAAELLTKTLAENPPETLDSATARDLWILLSGYREVLGSRSPHGLEPALTALDALRSSMESPFGASPSVVSWVELWQAELGTRLRLPACTTRQCRDRETTTRRTAWERLTRGLGARTRALFESGVVPLGGATIDLRYDAELGLLPRVAIDVAFPLVEVPAAPEETAKLRR
jgi:hypothetical protein